MSGNDNASLGALIQAKRMARGWTQDVMGKSLRKSASTISDWEHGKKRPSARSVPLLSALIGIDPEHVARMIAAR
jgi:transcriptional regulator with XRE-family HTH domain